MSDVQVIEVETEEFVVEVTAAGARGPIGPDGASGDKDETFIQALPAATWVITHSMGKYPSVTTVDSADTVILGAVTYDSISQITVEFGGAFSGFAFLN